MGLNTTQLKKLAQLSKIAIADDDLEEMAAEVSAIIEHVESLNEIDTTDVEPVYQVNGIVNTLDDLRVDEITKQVPSKTLLTNAPEKVGTSIKVPKVL
ncbi:Asp-tRNA(Asn)/Glu-tRNA(Gln) amidotransferase subunit GatC [Candidatus Saccharibacteria bacterium]|jgi:aspartyl-tRNA(Asn)/glutamyl-tRNA(Gln) amidotransferase subunit C|nr:Asp-tRNA(Asn)/Glu-tRNA(Gln) amidotransferase subunit GatC [Candidatus Saccharibacteria bacterium]